MGRFKQIRHKQTFVVGGNKHNNISTHIYISIYLHIYISIYLYIYISLYNNQAARGPLFVLINYCITSNRVSITEQKTAKCCLFFKYIYGVYKKPSSTLMPFNSDKMNFYSFILGSLFSLILCLFNEGSCPCLFQATSNFSGRNLPEAIILRCLKISISNY